MTLLIHWVLQVLISYGELSNDALLQRYGFVEKSNPHERWDVWTWCGPVAGLSDSAPADAAYPCTCLLPEAAMLV
jgi:hypothetical protein